jgi:hypothetical protein
VFIVHIAQPCCSNAGSLCSFAISMQASAISAADPKHDGIDLTPHLQVVARDAGRHAARMREQQAAKPVNLILNLRSSCPA